MFTGNRDSLDIRHTQSWQYGALLEIIIQYTSLILIGHYKLPAEGYLQSWYNWPWTCIRTIFLMFNFLSRKLLNKRRTVGNTGVYGGGGGGPWVLGLWGCTLCNFWWPPEISFQSIVRVLKRSVTSSSMNACTRISAPFEVVNNCAHADVVCVKWCVKCDNEVSSTCVLSIIMIVCTHQHV